MGLEENKTKLTVQCERRLLINAISGVINANISIMELHKKSATNTKQRNLCKKSINQSRESLIKIKNIKHIEILRSLYNNIIMGKETIFVMSGALLTYPQVEKWDTTEDGFKEFMELEQKAHQEEVEDFERKVKEQQAIEEAQKNGDSVEYVYDKESGTTKQVIVKTDNVA